MADPLFKNCNVEFVPVVDFKFVESCTVPDLPPPTFDCPPPNCPLPEPPPPCPTIKSDAVSVNVVAKLQSADCKTEPSAPPSGKINVTQTAEECSFAIGLDLDIPITIPAIPCPEFSSGTTTVKANYGSCEPSKGEVTVTPKPNLDPCAGDGACKFDLGLDLALSIPPPPCPKITVSGTADSKAEQLTGTGEITPGSCTEPECNIKIEIRHPPIPTIPQTTTLISNYFTSNINTSIQTFIETNIENIVEITGPTINTYINNSGGVCVPKIKAGKIELCTTGSGGAFTIAGENDEKHCQYPIPPSDFTCPRCYFPGPAGIAACRQHAGTAQDCLDAGGIPYDIGPISGDPDVDAGCSTPFVFPTACENVAQKDDPDTYCNSKSGTIVTGPCGQTKKCPDLTISGKICVEQPCVTTYLGGDISISLSDDLTAEPTGEIKIGSPTKFRSCYFPSPSDGFALWGRSCVSLSEIAASGEPPLQFCPDYGGTLKTTYSCEASCDDKEITATLTLPKSLSKVKFESSGAGSLTYNKCGAEKPYVNVTVEIKEKAGEAGTYSIEVSGDFCTCCADNSAEPEAPAGAT